MYAHIILSLVRVADRPLFLERVPHSVNRVLFVICLQMLHCIFVFL